MRLAPILVALLLYCACGPCDDEVQSESVSPDRALAATSFVRNCGATTDFSTIVSVHRPGDTYRDENTFVFVARGRERVELKWNAPKKLQIHCKACERENIFKKVTALGDIDIDY